MRRKNLLQLTLLLGALLPFQLLLAPRQPYLSLDYSWEAAPGVMETVRAFDAFLESSIAEGMAPGAALAIVHRGRILLTKGYGVRAVHDPQAVDAHTIFRLASVSKTISGVLTGKLVQEGVFDWDDPVSEYLPDLCLQTDDHTESLQLAHLLSHTTGLPYHTFSNLIERGMDMDEMIDQLHDVDLIAKAGAVYSYQNVAFSLVGEVIEETTCLDFEESLKKELFIPLNMSDASASFKGFVTNPNAAQPHRYSRRHGWRQLRPSPNYYNTAPAGGINASAHDMANYLRALLGARPDVLAPDVLEQLATPYVFTPVRYRYFGHWKDVQKTYYGLGWRIVDMQDQEVLYHGGYVGGYRAEIAVFPEKELGICVLFNGETGLASQSIPQFLEFLKAGKEVL